MESEISFNETRADWGHDAISAAANQTGVDTAEPAVTAILDVLSYVCHFCDRLSLSPQDMLAMGHDSYLGDFEDGPKARARFDAHTLTLAEIDQNAHA